jgi:hypothetical protein
MSKARIEHRKHKSICQEKHEIQLKHKKTCNDRKRIYVVSIVGIHKQKHNIPPELRTCIAYKNIPPHLTSLIAFRIFSKVT